jgi:hypothetical protein
VGLRAGLETVEKKNISNSNPRSLAHSPSLSRVEQGTFQIQVRSISHAPLRRRSECVNCLRSLLYSQWKNLLWCNEQTEADKHFYTHTWATFCITDITNIIQIRTAFVFSIFYHVICCTFQAISRWLPTAAARFRAPQSPSSVIWGWYNRPIVAAVPSGLVRNRTIMYYKSVTCTSNHKCMGFAEH